jgi:translation initiation factor 1
VNDIASSGDINIGSGLIHIRIQQRNGRKTLTTVQGLSEDIDKKKLVRAFKKDFACNGTVVDHAEYGEVIQLQGDQRTNVCAFLKKIGIKDDQLKVIFRKRFLLDFNQINLFFFRFTVSRKKDIFQKIKKRKTKLLA